MSESNKDSTKTKSPGWINLDRYDLFCLISICWFFVSVVVAFDGSEKLNSALRIQATHEKFVFILGSFILMISIFKMSFGIKGISIAMLRFWTWPLFLFYYFSSYSIQLVKTYKKLKNNLPWKFLYFSIIPIFYAVGLFSENLIYLNLIKWGLLIHLFITLYWGIKWSLNPFNFLDYLKVLGDHKIRAAVAVNLVKLDKSENTITVTSLLKKVDGIKKLIEVFEKFLITISSNRILFACFLGVLFVVTVHIVIGGAIVLRVMHLESLPHGIFQANNFFSGTVLDYFYISINSFLPGGLHGIEFVSADARWIFTSISFSSLLLLVVAIAGFSMAGTSKVEEVVKTVSNNMGKVIEDAASHIKNRDESILITTNDVDKKSNGKVIEVNTTNKIEFKN